MRVALAHRDSCDARRGCGIDVHGHIDVRARVRFEDDNVVLLYVELARGGWVEFDPSRPCDGGDRVGDGLGPGEVRELADADAVTLEWHQK